MLSFQRSVVEEAIIYIEELQQQLWRRMEQKEMDLHMELKLELKSEDEENQRMQIQGREEM